jgi:hypothetical protein
MRYGESRTPAIEWGHSYRYGYPISIPGASVQVVEERGPTCVVKWLSCYLHDMYFSILWFATQENKQGLKKKKKKSGLAYDKTSLGGKVERLE